MTAKRAGGACLFRLTGLNDTENFVDDDRIDFTTGLSVGTNPNADSYLSAAIPSPASNTSPIRTPGTVGAAQYAGVSGYPLTLEGFFDERASNAAQTLLAKWMREPQADLVPTATKIFAKGRFGFRDDARQAYNVKPTATAGYLLLDYDAKEDPQTFGLVNFTIKLLFVGPALDLGTYVLKAEPV